MDIEKLILCLSLLLNDSYNVRLPDTVNHKNSISQHDFLALSHFL